MRFISLLFIFIINFTSLGFSQASSHWISNEPVRVVQASDDAVVDVNPESDAGDIEHSESETEKTLAVSDQFASFDGYYNNCYPVRNCFYDRYGRRICRRLIRCN